MHVRVIALFLFAIAVPLPVLAQNDGGVTNTTTYTTSTKNIYDITYNTATQRVDTFAVELIARMQGGQTLYDQTFNVAFTDPAVSAAIATAEGVLTTNGASSFLGPNLLSDSTSLFSTISQTGAPVVTGTDVSYVTTLYVGPRTIMVGDLQSLPFTIPAGGMDFDTLVTSTILETITTTTTNTFLTKDVYEIDGVAGTSSVPEPATLGLMVMGLVGVFGGALRRKRTIFR